MKAISLWQPWATLVAIGAKRVETRGWATRHVGAIAIHAGKKFQPLSGRAGRAAAEALRAAGLPADGSGLPGGAIVAVCEIERCAPVDRRVVSVTERLFGDYSSGRYAWFLSNVRRLAEPIPWRGARRWFEVPDEVLRDVAILGDSDHREIGSTGGAGTALTLCPGVRDVD